MCDEGIPRMAFWCSWADRVRSLLWWYRRKKSYWRDMDWKESFCYSIIMCYVVFINNSKCQMKVIKKVNKLI